MFFYARERPYCLLFILVYCQVVAVGWQGNKSWTFVFLTVWGTPPVMSVKLVRSRTFGLDVDVYYFIFLALRFGAWEFWGGLVVSPFCLSPWFILGESFSLDGPKTVLDHSLGLVCLLSFFTHEPIYYIWTSSFRMRNVLLHAFVLLVVCLFAWPSFLNLVRPRKNSPPK